MAIQEVEKREAQGTVGIRRKINAAAEGMVMDIVQAQQYTKPIPSTVRELTANAVDSQSEKERALDILKGDAKPEDYFITREGELYADSNWTPEYYNTNHLDLNNNTVKLTYRDKVNGGGRCDSFLVKDYGVGIGARRLEGVLEIGFSTKRNRKDALGAFGLGAKVGLATGADYYKLTTVYNGVKYKIQVFNKKLNSLIGKLNTEKNEENVSYTFSDGSVIYGEKTNEKNYTEIEVPALKHHKQDYITAVKTQLLYFKNVEFAIETVYENHTETHPILFQAETLYNSSNLVISDNSPYSKPHVIIVKGGEKGSETGVCYGHIDFKEMELQDMNGDIGIKCPIRQVIEDEEGNEIVINEGVDVVPSREAVRWTPATRDFLKKQFTVAQEEATGLIEKELKEKDFLKWIGACKAIALYSGHRNSAIGRLSRIVDLNSIKPKFNNKEGVEIKFDTISELFSEFVVTTYTKTLDKDKKYDVKNTETIGWNHFQQETLYVKTTNLSKIKNLYLCDQNDSESFNTITPKDDSFIKLAVESKITATKLSKKQQEKIIQDKIKRRDVILNLIKDSSFFQSYDNTEVPEDYIKSLKKLEEQFKEAETKEVKLTPEQERKLNQRVVAHTLVPRYNTYTTEDTQTYQNSKVEPKIEYVKNYQGTLYYALQADLDKLQFAAHILDRNLEKTQDGRFMGENYILVSISKSNKKYFANHKHINDFFGESVTIKENGKIKGTKIIMDSAITLWNTARKISPYMEELSFLSNFSNFDEEIAKDYVDLVDYVNTNYVPLSDYKHRFGMAAHYQDFIAFLEKIEELQTFCEEESDETKIAEKVQDIVLPKNGSLPKGTIGGIAVDREMIKKLEKVLEYANPVKDLLNHIPLLKHQSNVIPIETSILIKEYLEFKGL